MAPACVPAPHSRHQQRPIGHFRQHVQNASVRCLWPGHGVLFPEQILGFSEGADLLPQAIVRREVSVRHGLLRRGAEEATALHAREPVLDSLSLVGDPVAGYDLCTPQVPCTQSERGSERDQSEDASERVRGVRGLRGGLVD